MADAKSEKKSRRSNISEALASLIEIVEAVVDMKHKLASLKVDKEDRPVVKKVIKLYKQLEKQVSATKDIESKKTIRLNTDRAEELLAECIEWAKDCRLTQIADLLALGDFENMAEKLDASVEKRYRHTCRGMIRNAVFDIFHQCLNHPKNMAHSNDDFETFMQIYRPNGKASKLLPFATSLPATCHDIYKLYIAREGSAYNIGAQSWDISGSMLSTEIIKEKLPKVIFGLEDKQDLPEGTAPTFETKASKICVALMSKQSAEEMISVAFKLLFHMGGLNVVSKANKNGKYETVYEVKPTLDGLDGAPKNPMFSLFRLAEKYQLAERTPTGGIARPAEGSDLFATHNHYSKSRNIIECKKLEFNCIARFFTLSAYIPEIRVTGKDSKKKFVQCPNFSDIATACSKFTELKADGSPKTRPAHDSSQAVAFVYEHIVDDVSLLDKIISVSRKRTQLDTFFFAIAKKCATADDRQNWLKAVSAEEA